MFIIFIKSVASIIKFIITFFSFIFSKFIKMRIVRKYFKYKIIQKIFDDHKNLIISNLCDLSFDFLIEILVVFAFLANYINKFNIFKFTIYE